MGGSGKTAKMKAAQTCYNEGYYKHTINDCGDWKFSANCYSDESARDEGYDNRNIASLASCKKKYYKEIDPNTFKDHGDWFYSLKCSMKDKAAEEAAIKAQEAVRTSCTC